MANRLYRCQAFNTNSQAIGGVSTFGMSATFRTIVRALAEGSIGVSAVDRVGLRVTVRLSLTDVTTVNAILAAAVGNTTFSCKEVGAATYSNYTLGDSGIVWTGFSISAREDQDAVLNLDGQVRFSAAAKDIDDIIVLDSAAVAAGTATYPTRLYRPKSASFDPTGTDPAVTPLKVVAINMSLAANVVEDGLEDDVGMTVVEIQDWNPLNVSLTFRDATEVTGPPDTDTASHLLKQGIGVLTAGFKARAGGADQTLTINGLTWTGMDPSHQQGLSEFTVRGEAQWREGEVDYQINSGTKLFSFA